MKKILVRASLLMAILSSSCKKEDKKLANSWKIDGTTYTSVYVAYTSGQMTVADAAGNTCTFTFNSTGTLPGAGTYKVVAGPVPGDHELMITALKKGASDNITYESTGTEDVNATITVDGADITISVPDVAVREVSTVSNATAVARFSAYQLTTK